MSTKNCTCLVSVLLNSEVYFILFDFDFCLNVIVNYIPTLLLTLVSICLCFIKSFKSIGCLLIAILVLFYKLHDTFNMD